MIRLLYAILGGTAELAVLRSAAQMMRALAIQIALAMLALFLGLGAAGCAAASLWIWARAPLGSAGAALLVATVCAVACALVGLVMSHLWRTRGTVSSSSQQIVRATGDQALLSMRLATSAARGFRLGLNGETVPRG
jgi:hypothetical protein